MPRGKKLGNKVIGDGIKWNGFVVCEFDADSRQRFGAWLSDQTPGDVWTWFIEQVDTFKITFSWADAQSCYMVSMTGTDPEQQDYFGWTLSARGRDVDRTLHALRFKHEIILNGKWVHQVTGDKKPDDWVG